MTGGELFVALWCAGVLAIVSGAAVQRWRLHR